MARMSFAGLAVALIANGVAVAQSPYGATGPLNAVPTQPLWTSFWAPVSVTGFGVGPVEALLAQQPTQEPVSTQQPTTDASATQLPLSSFAGPGVCDSPACGPAGRFWLEADYLFWQVKGDAVPPLVTTSPAGTHRNQAGVPGTPGVATLFGGSNVGENWESGGQLRLGYWFDCQQAFGIQAGFFMLENPESRFNAASAGAPILARPFFNSLTGAVDSEIIAFPGVAAGATFVRDSASLYGLSAALRFNLCCNDCSRVDALLGYRYLRMTDDLSVAELLTSTDPNNPNVPLGTRIGVVDEFNTTNNFNGVDLGFTGEFRHGPWSLEWLAKVALGANHGEVGIDGTTTVRVPGVALVTERGGLLALSSNSGNFDVNRFAVVPELGLKLGYQITPHLRATVGYEFLYWSNVVRPGDQIDTRVNPNLLPPPILPLAGPARPAPQLATTDLWLQGVSFGFEFRY
jgi:hypothetical protein